MHYLFFNADHDLALAHGSPYYQAPAAIEAMNRDLEMLMAWFAPASPSTLLVRRMPSADFLRHLCPLLPVPIALHPLTPSLRATDIPFSFPHTFTPWGVNPRSQSLFNPPLPTNPQLEHLSSKARLEQWLPLILPSFAPYHTDVLTRNLTTWHEVEACVMARPTVVRDPLSSSGKGVRMMTLHHLTRYDREWCTGVIRSRGCVVVSAQVEKLMDWSIQLHIDANAHTTVTGLCSFATNSQGAYSGNALISSSEVYQLLTQHVTPHEVDTALHTVKTLVQQHIAPHYSGPCGADMMLFLDSHTPRLYPLVELNLRHTMGQLALRLHASLHRCQKLTPHSSFQIIDRQQLAQLQSDPSLPIICLTPLYPDTRFVGVVVG